MKQFAQWLSTTLPSVFIQEHNAWAIPTIQSIHIVGIAMIMGSVLMIDLRILGWAGMDRTLRQTTSRFGPWLTGSLWLLLATGILMVIGEPVRELVTFSFWLKMTLVAIGSLVAVLFQAALRRHEQQWEDTLLHGRSIKWLAILTFLTWAFVIVLGRLIAYDHVWGSLVTGGEPVVGIHSALVWLQETGLATHIRDSLFVFPLLEAVHVIGLALVFGTIAVIDLRLLGLASTDRSFKRMAADIMKWTWAAFALTALTGGLMFMTNAVVYSNNFAFRVKIVLLVLAGLNMLVFELTAWRTIHRWDQAPSAPPIGRAVASLSLIIWIAVIFAGRIIGFTTTRAAVTESAPVELDFDNLLGVPADGGQTPAVPPDKK